jgi:hypothetical protein
MQGNDFSRFPGRNRSGHVPLNFPFFSPFNSLSRIGIVDRQS